MSEISVVVVGSTSISSVVGNGDTVNINVGDQTIGGGDGSAATIQVGSVTTLDATQAASIVNVGTAYAAKLDFAIPRGYTGSAGPANSLSIGSVSTGATAAVSISGTSPSQSISFVLQPGPTGPANSLSVGSVSTGTTAAVSITGTAPSQSLSFVLPRGPEGPANSLSIGSVSTGATAAVSISGAAPSQSLSFVLQPGPTGPANSLSIGSVSTGATAAVSITGTAPSQSLSFVLQPGPVGPANSLSIGGVSTGTTAAVSISGVAPSQSLSFVLPIGPKGDTGAAGPQGPSGSVNLADEMPQPLGTASAGTALTAARADHVHAVGSITYSSLSGIPSTFAPSAHVHAVADVTGLQTALDGKQAAGSYATLVGGQVPSSQLPSFVDDVIDVGGTLPASGDVGKIYVVSTGGSVNKIYRWSGSAFIEISPSPGSTDSVTEGSTNLYFTTVRAAAAAPVQSVNTKTGTVTLTASDVGAAATSHKHTLADISQSSATTGQVPTWNGTAWAAATPSAGGGGGGSANIVEAATASSFPATGASETLYIATDVSRIYRWSGGVYVEIGTAGGGGSSSEDPRWDYFKPPAPTGVSATKGNAQATVSWTAPASSVLPITDYVVQFQQGSGAWQPFTDSVSTSTSATVTGLQNSVAHQFRVAAVNAIGQGPWSAASASVTPDTGDPYWANVSLLMKFEGSSLSDSSANNFSLSLDNSTGSVATLTSSYSRFGTKSLNSGASSSFATPNSAAFGFGTGDFTIEYWFYYTGHYDYAWWIASPFVVSIEPYGVNGVWYGGANSANTFPTNQWVHVAVCRASGVVSAYMGGVRQYTVGDTTDYGSSDALRYGRAGGYPLPTGYLDELRVTKGIARYAGATLTEPTAAFPDS